MLKLLLTIIVVCGIATGNVIRRFESSSSDNTILVVGVVNQSVDQPSVGYMMGFNTGWLIIIPSTEFPQTANEDWRDLGVARNVLTNSSHPP